MGSFTSIRKAYGALKDTTKVGLAKVNSDFKDLDIAIVKATNHVECPPKERHVRRIFSATSIIRPRADVAYCIHALAKRLSKTRNWVVAIKVLIVIHRTLREGDPTFREELLNFAQRGNILQISNFKDDSGINAWDCSAWVRSYAHFLEERLECFRVLRYDIEAEHLTKLSPTLSKVQSRTRVLNRTELLEQLPALQQLLYRLIGCQPEGAAYSNYLVQYALALILKESFKIYCAVNDGIINLVDMFFDMSRHDAIKALTIYKRAGQQAENLADFYEHCKGLDLARTFQFPTLRQPPPSFLATMEEYIREAPQLGSVNKRVEYSEDEEENEEQQPDEEPPDQQTTEAKEEEAAVQDEKEVTEEATPEIKAEEQTPVPEPSPLIPTDGTDDLLGFMSEINPKVAELDESNALALAIIPSGEEASTCANNVLAELGKPNASGWELALVTAPSNSSTRTPPPQTKLAGGFDQLLLDSLYEDDATRRQIELTNAGYRTKGSLLSMHSPYEQQQQCQLQRPDPFAMSNNVAPPTNVQMATTAQQMQFYTWQHQQQQQDHQQQQHQSIMAPFQQGTSSTGFANPFGDPFITSSTSTSVYPQSHVAPNDNRMLL